METIQTPDIKALSHKIIDPNIDDESLKDSIGEIYQYFQQVTHITGYDEHMHHLAAVPAQFGKALGLNHAAQCLLDVKRTALFLRALTEAIAEKQKEYPGEQIKIFYAGCGPYAPFITLVAPMYSPEEVRFTLLDINKESLSCAQMIIEHMEIVDYVEAMYCNDAITCEVPNPESYHILFSETLDAMLYRECYVPILWNLLPQFPENTILIPENVKLKMSFTGKDQTGWMTESKPITLFDVRAALSEIKPGEALPSILPAATIVFDEIKLAELQMVIMDTEVVVSKNYVLKRGESQLTQPLIQDIQEPEKIESFTFAYHLAPEIELKHTAVFK